MKRGVPLDVDATRETVQTVDTGGFKGALRVKLKKFPNTKCYEVFKRTVPQSCVMIFIS